MQGGRFLTSGEHFINGHRKVIFRIQFDVNTSMAQESFHCSKVTIKH